MSPGQQIIVEVLVAGVAAGLFGIIGVLVGARMQKHRWIAEKKRSEYRKLLTTMVKAFTGKMREGTVRIVWDPSEQRKLAKSEQDAHVVLLDRVFIADEVLKLKLLKRWNKAIADYDETSDHKAFANAFGLISQDIRKSAGALIADSDSWYERVGKIIKELDHPA